MDLQVQLPQDWQEALRRGQAVAAEITAEGASAGAQELAEAMLQQRQDAAFFFLETQAAEGGGRFSLMAGEPLFSFLARGRRGVWHGAGMTRDLNEAPEDSFESLGRAFRRCGVAEAREGLSPFLGWLSYEAGARFERLPLPKPDPLGMPDWYLMLPGKLAWLDPELGQWRFRLLLAETAFYVRIQESLGLPTRGSGERPAGRVEESIGLWKAQVAELLASARSTPATQAPKEARSLQPSDNMGQEAFCSAVSRARGYISDGDVFQVNLSHRQSAPYKGRAWPLFRRLSQINPSPYACFAELGSYQIISASPERLFSQDGDHVETHPIAGTMPRDRAPEELRISEKDMAEHVMTVDIERNDLGRVCEPGSVKVRDLMALETYSHLHHLVSRVEGGLRQGCDLPDLFRAAFPGGSVTGAPKIRCMEIIAELEGERRGLYTGSLGYWDPVHRKADFNILIRTLLLGHGKALWQVGAGIVADSDPQKEWEETQTKAAALKLALETAPL